MIETIAAFYKEHEVILGIIGGISVLLFFASILSLPFLVSLIPVDYFQNPEPYKTYRSFKHPVIRILIISAKNIAGWSLIFAGILMLLLPGQGLIALSMGVALINFPGKRKVVCKLIGNQRIFRSINWLREKRNKKPLLAPE